MALADFVAAVRRNTAMDGRGTLFFSGRESGFPQGSGDLRPGSSGLDFDQASGRIGGDARIRVNVLNGFDHGARAAAADHVVEMELHGNPPF